MLRKLEILLGLLIASLLAGSLAAAEEVTADFYVSPKGSDEWSGTLAEPDDGGANGPFATLARARDAVRELKKSKSTDIVVLVREGTYRLEETVVFGLEDSGAGRLDDHLCSLSRRKARVQFRAGNQGLGKGDRRVARLAERGSGQGSCRERFGSFSFAL